MKTIDEFYHWVDEVRQEDKESSMIDLVKCAYIKGLISAPMYWYLIEIEYEQERVSQGID